MIDFFKHNLDLSRMTWLSGLQEVFSVIDIYFYLLESNVGKKDPRCHNMPITIGSIFEKGQGALHEKD